MRAYTSGGGETGGLRQEVGMRSEGQLGSGNEGVRIHTGSEAEG